MNTNIKLKKDTQLDTEDTLLMEMDNIIDEVSSYRIKFCPLPLSVDSINYTNDTDKYSKVVDERIWFNNIIF